MKPVRGFIIVCSLAGILVLTLVVRKYYLTHYLTRNDIGADRTAEVKQMLRGAGGIEEVNREAEDLLNRFGTNEMRSMSSQELVAFPSISRLGNMVRISPSVPNMPANITVRYGSHQDTRFLYIFGPRTVLDIKSVSGLVQVEGNVYVAGNGSVYP